MPKKVFTFEAKTVLNKEKGGGWLATIIIKNDQDDNETVSVTAWKNASASKKWLKAQAAAKTPRKSVKLVAGPETDDKGKPARFYGSFTYRDPK